MGTDTGTTTATTSSEDGATAQDLVVATALDYFEGWYSADVDRMERALHDDLVKRSAGPDGGYDVGERLTKQQMLELTRLGGGTEEGAVAEQGIEVEVLDVFGRTASVVVRSKEYHEHLHLVQTPAGWKIANAFWQNS